MVVSANIYLKKCVKKSPSKSIWYMTPCACSLYQLELSCCCCFVLFCFFQVSFNSVTIQSQFLNLLSNILWSHSKDRVHDKPPKIVLHLTLFHNSNCYTTRSGHCNSCKGVLPFIYCFLCSTRCTSDTAVGHRVERKDLLYIWMMTLFCM